jgi:MFS family permease
MMGVFFCGSGLAAIATGFAETPLQVGIGLFVIGIFGAIYHPVGLAIVTAKWKNMGSRIAVNGVWGNLGVAGAALLTGFLIAERFAYLPSAGFCLAVGAAAAVLLTGLRARAAQRAGPLLAAAAIVLLGARTLVRTGISQPARVEWKSATAGNVRAQIRLAGRHRSG